jgi:outer membrane protein OmpA-like peptidoglycan-associated protein
MKKTLILVVTLGLVLGCTTPGKRTAIGAGAGAAGGAIVGGIAGGGKGALIGAAAGAVVGGVIGNYLDKQARDLAEVADTERTPEGILVNLKSELLFPTGKATLTPNAKTQLAKLSKVLRKYDKNIITIEGHTDSTGPMSFNMELSKLRAQVVRQELLNNGVKASSIETIGYGPTRPIASNITYTGRNKNRRVEIKIIADESLFATSY